jgi:hypothetical protein
VRAVRALRYGGTGEFIGVASRGEDKRTVFSARCVQGVACWGERAGEAFHNCLVPSKAALQAV